MTQNTVDTEMAEDDWIAPLKSTSAPSRPALSKSNSAESVTIAQQHAALVKDIQVETEKQEQITASLTKSFIPRSPLKTTASQEHLLSKQTSTAELQRNFPTGASFTPVGSPTRKQPGEGALSASKAKLYSVLRSAKGIFASSAGASASAKMEALFEASLLSCLEMINKHNQW